MQVKRYFLICIVAIISLCVCSCKGQKTQTSKASELKEGTIEMAKTPCHGRCPIYTIKIKSTGEAIFEGKRNVDKLGTYTKKLSEKEVTDLFNSFNGSIYNFQDKYDAKVTDVPSTIISFNYDGKAKTIVDRFEAPDELKKLEKLVEMIADSSDWEKVADLQE